MTHFLFVIPTIMSGQQAIHAAFNPSNWNRYGRVLKQFEESGCVAALAEITAENPLNDLSEERHMLRLASIAASGRCAYVRSH